jgi:hypothetical protein
VGESKAAGTCGQCGGPVQVAGTGRPRRWCGQACRQAAYRARHAEGRPAGDAVQARGLASSLASAARLLAHAVASPAAGDEAARQEAADQAAAALAALAGLAGVNLPGRDETPVPVMEPVLVPVPARVGSPAKVPVTWRRSTERSTWVAEVGEAMLAVTRLTGGEGWRPMVRSPGRAEATGPVSRTRIGAQQWAERHLWAGQDRSVGA